MNLEEIKQIEFISRDLNKKITILEYLKTLLLTLWDEGESFSGKRPFGNSDWEYELYIALVDNKIIKGKIDEDGYIEEMDRTLADRIIVNIIKDLK